MKKKLWRAGGGATNLVFLGPKPPLMLSSSDPPRELPEEVVKTRRARALIASGQLIEVESPEEPAVEPKKPKTAAKKKPAAKKKKR